MFSRIVAVMLAATTIAASAYAGCSCACVNGRMQPLCTNALDVRPICPATTCSVPSAGVAPVQPSFVPPLGTKRCEQKQVTNPYSGAMEWKSVCY